MATAIIFISGLILGSFYNVCIYRMARNQSILFPPSHCPNCQNHLKAMDLIPVLSYILLRGKCRYCEGKISPIYPIVELLTAFIFTALYWKYGLDGKFVAYCTLVSILIIASLIDLDKQIIPNGLVLIGAAAGLILSIFNLSVDIVNGLLGLLLGGGSLFLIAALSLLVIKKEGMGGGDIKLMGMIGLFLGWKDTIPALLLSIYIGGIVSGLLLVFKVKTRGQHIPFGPFIALGTIVTILWGDIIVSWYCKNFF